MASARTDPGLELRPMVPVDDMAASIAFYRQLGAEVIHGGKESAWVLLQLGFVQVGLVARAAGATRSQEGGVELHFGSSMPLAQLRRRLHKAGFASAAMTQDRDFGEQLSVRTPEGLLLKISQREPE